LHQAAQILLRRARDVMMAGAEEIIEVLTKSPVGRAQLFERFVMVNPVFAVRFR